MDEIWNILYSIPATVWSALLGAGMTLIGVLISNKNHTDRLKIQLEHDSQIKANERKIAMRRDVYLEAAENLVKASAYIGSLPSKGFNQDDHSKELQGFFSSSAKLGLIAEEDTRNALNKLVIAYNKLIFNMLVQVHPISELNQEALTLKDFANKFQKELDRILQKMALLGESLGAGSDEWNVLKQSYEVQHQQFAEYSSKHVECLNRIAEKNKELSLFLMKEMKEIGQLQIPVFVGIRKELELETDISVYEQQANEVHEALEKELEILINAVEK